MANKRFGERNNKPTGNHDKLGIVIAIISLFILLCIAIPPMLGVFSMAIFNVMLGVFGFASYPMLVALAALGICILLRRGRPSARTTVCVILTVFFLLVILQLATTHSYLDKPFSSYMANVYDVKFTAGGVVFGAISYGLQALITEIACYVIFSVAIIVTVIFMTGLIGRLRARKTQLPEQPKPAKKPSSNFATRGEPGKVVPVDTVRELYIGTVTPHAPSVVSETGVASDIPVREKRNVTSYGPSPLMTIEQAFTDNRARTGSGASALSAIYGDAAAIGREETEEFGRRYREETHEEAFPKAERQNNDAYVRSQKRDDALSEYTADDGIIDVRGKGAPAQAYEPATERPTRKDYDGTNGITDIVFPPVKNIEFNNADDIMDADRLKPADEPRYDARGTGVSAPFFKPDYSSAPQLDDIIDASVKPPEPEPAPEPAPMTFDDKFKAMIEANSASLSAAQEEAEEEIFDAFEERDRFAEAPADDLIDDGDDDILDGSAFAAAPKSPNILTASNGADPVTDPDGITDASNIKVSDSTSDASGGRSSLVISDAPVIDLSEKHDVTSDIIAGDDLSGMYVSADSGDVEQIKTSGQKQPKREKRNAPLENQITLDSVMKKQAEETVVINEKKRSKKYNYTPPPIDLLQVRPKNEVSQEDLAHKAEILEQVISGYLKAEVKVINIVPGPTVTRYELEVPSGVTVKSIEARSADIKYELAAKSIRIEAPIPGKRAVGIEVPNAEQETIGLREVIEHSKFAKAKSPLTFSVGKDISGDMVLCDLEKIPHLLIAGQTGSGKSACLNGLLVSLLYKSSPEDVRFILIDPKRVEFSKYGGMPHLLLDKIVVEQQEALNALKWAANEMERRYTLLQKYACGQVSEFNKLPDVENGTIDKMPHIIVIVDELADLMASQYKGEIENRIMVIAAKARAAGIHLIVATQRPSADVITGTIKTNLTSRISFKVSQQIDSRIILDMTGAEELLGNGDMLFYPVTFSAPLRVQGSFISGTEVAAVVNYIKDHFETDFNEDASKFVFGNGGSGGGGGGEASNTDPLLPRVLAQAVTAKQISTSVIQRRFAIGYARAARIIDSLEESGYIGPSTGNSKPRDVLMTPEQYRAEFGDSSDEG